MQLDPFLGLRKMFGIRLDDFFNRSVTLGIDAIRKVRGFTIR